MIIIDMKLATLFFSLLTLFAATYSAKGQTEARTRPTEWNNLVYGGRFMDLFQPMPKMGELTRDTWGADNVLPRYINNGIENRQWSYWGGNIKLGEDGKYHFYVCGWLESSPKGHNTWPNSIVFHAVSDNSFGPFVVKDTIGKGHNPEIFRLKDGRYVLYVIDGYYISNGCNGPWTYGKFEFLNRDRKIIEGLSNLTFAQREDGSYLMICRGGGQWFSKTGLTAYNQVTEKRAYPNIKGRFEDPVLWRDNIQYNLIVNDWLGRTAFYLRSKDGVKWKVESGEAYMPGVARHEDGSVEGWFKFERLKIFQDALGRAQQANFAVIDVEKKFDLGSDIHSSKNISIPLTVGRLITLLDKDQISADTKTIKLKIVAEKGFNPQTDIDMNSLQFGVPEDVNYGKGCKVLKSEKAGKDLVVTFSGNGKAFPEDEFAGKMIGKTTAGKLLFGYARLPWVNYMEPILSARMPVITPNDNGFDLKVEVQNFGQVTSQRAKIQIWYTKDGNELQVGTGEVSKLKPFEKTTVKLVCSSLFDKGVEYNFTVLINPDTNPSSTLLGKMIVVK
ncbi:MAG: hypothetical protein HXX14_17065 [Bacteroidetes bacterium]|nr:hypothetical protein [Bacteroidota bacterium]